MSKTFRPQQPTLHVMRFLSFAIALFFFTVSTEAAKTIAPPEKGPIKVAFVMSESATMIDFAGPWEVFQDVHVESRGPSMEEMMPFELYTVSDSRKPIRTSGGMQVIPDYTFDDAPVPRVVVIGAQSGNSPKMYAWSARARALVLLSVAELLGMALWFGVSAVAPQIAREWNLGGAQSAWLTLSVQLGFVAGTFLSAIFNLPDIIRARHLLTIAMLLGAAMNALLACCVHSLEWAVFLRFLTGAFLAGVYPPGMKLVATWFRDGRGFALGILVGALTLGKGSPYLVNAIGSSNWRVNVAVTSLLGVIGAAVVAIFVRDGPYALPNQPFDITQVAAVFRNRGVRLAN